jgi:hypothetical protein
MSTVSVKIIKQTVADGRSVKVGQVVDLCATEARFLVKISRAIYHAEEEVEAPAPVVEPELVAEDSPLEIGRASCRERV